MTEARHNDLSSPPRPAARLGYVLLAGALVVAFLATTAESQGPSQKAPAGADKAPRKPMLNLMSIIDTSLDPVRGKWALTGNVLRCDDQHFVPRLQIQYEPPEEYDFYIQFSQPNLRHPVSAILPN